MSKRVLPITPWGNASHWALKFKPLAMLCAIWFTLLGWVVQVSLDVLFKLYPQRP